jgi:hypothetical protein
MGRLVSALLWIALISGFVWFRKPIYKHATNIALFLALMMTSSVLIEAQSNKTHWGENVLELPDDSFLKFSKNKNVVVIVLDSLNSTFFQRILDKDASYAEKFADFTYFRNTLGSYPETLLSIPTILTGQTFNNETHVKKYIQSVFQASLPYALQKQSFATSLITKTSYCSGSKGIPCFELADYFASGPEVNKPREAAQMADLVLFKYSMHWLRTLLFTRGNSVIEEALFREEYGDSRWENLALADKIEKSADTSSEQPTFKFIHMSIPHPPFVRDDECRYFKKRKIKDPEKEKVVEDNYTKCGLKLALRIVGRIKQLGIYDQTAILILSDHGIGYNAGNQPGSDLFPGMGRAMAFMLVKPFNTSKAFTITDAPVGLVDVPATVADMLQLPLSFPGRPVFGVAEGEAREREYHYYPLDRRDWATGKMPNPLVLYSVLGHAWKNSSWRAQRTIDK